MEIKKSKEILILTQTEKAILSKALDILDDIYEACERDGDIECSSGYAMERIEDLLDSAEVEGGEPSETITITITV